MGTLIILFFGYRYTSKIFNEKSIPRLIMFTPLFVIVLLAFLSTTFYIEKTDRYFSHWSKRFVDDYINNEKRESEAWTQRIVNLFNYEASLVKSKMEHELKERISLAHQSATEIYERNEKLLPSNRIKQHIVDSLSGLQWYGKKNYVWITDYDGNNILTGNSKIDGVNISSYTDADGRSIILEEIQKVRKHGEGYLKTRFKTGDSEQLMFVKDFGHYEWFFGSGMHFDYEKTLLKERLLALIKKIPTDKRNFIAVYDENGEIYVSDTARAYLQNDLHVKFIKKPMWLDLNGHSAKIHVRY
ncbi:MAG: cache domain-containing protein, partial [Campylobacterota bacterium]|nr:cache domain-containing protein [Campylobacterota bacterium]